MNIMEAIEQRHSVRSYTNQKIEKDKAEKLESLIHDCNKKSGLHMQLVLDEPKAFSGIMAHYGKFENVKNYIALVARKDIPAETCGYYGEKVVLLAQQLGLNTCWVAMTYSKGKCGCTIEKGEKLVIVIALGYGATQGIAHKSKDMEQLSKTEGTAPEWFKKGMKAAMLAPTAMNQQKFLIELNGSTVTAKALTGFYTKLDLGIVKCHFELGANSSEWNWG